MTDTEKAEESTEEQVTLHGPGSIPGIPGDHGPGTYLVDWAARTIRPLLAPEIPEVEQQVSQETPPVTLTEIATEVTHLEADLQRIEQPG